MTTIEIPTATTARHRAKWSLIWIAYDRGHKHLPHTGTGRHRANA